MNRLNEMSTHFANVWHLPKEYIDPDKDIYCLLGHEARAIAIAVRCSHKPAGVPKTWWNGNREEKE